MKKLKYTLFLLLSFVLLFQCSKKQEHSNQTLPQKQTSNKWIKLSETLDFYDEVFTVKANFKLEIFINSQKKSEAGGKYIYNKGESKWFYLENGKLQKTIECYIDKAYVKLPEKKHRRHRRRRRRKKNNLPSGVVAVHEAKYPCALQALVHYNGALNRNKLTHDGKIFIVNDYDPIKKQINKFSIVKDSSTVLVYTFENIKFFDQEGKEINIQNKPVPKVEKPIIKPKPSVEKTNSGNTPEKTTPKPPEPKPQQKNKPVDIEEPPL